MENIVEQNRSARKKSRRIGKWFVLRQIPCLASASLLLCLSPAARAEDIEGFERLMDRGHAELDKAQYDTALSSFTEASLLSACPTALYWAGQTSEKLGQKAIALDYYERAIRQTPSLDAPAPCFAKGKRDSEAAATALRPRLAWLDVTVLGASAPLEYVELNMVRRPVPPSIPPQNPSSDAPSTVTFRLAIDPGSYSLKLAESERAKGTIAEGQVAAVRINLVPTTDRTRSADRGTVERRTSATETELNPRPARNNAATSVASSNALWTWGALGLGGAGVVLAGVSGWQVLRIKDELDGFAAVEQCYDPCPKNYNSKLSSAETWATVANIAGAAGAVGLGVGLWLLLTDEADVNPEQSGSLRWSVTPAGASAQVDW